jgi:hypothetical protein
MATLRDEEGGEVNRARHAPSEQRRLAPDCYTSSIRARKRFFPGVTGVWRRRAVRGESVGWWGRRLGRGTGQAKRGRPVTDGDNASRPTTRNCPNVEPRHRKSSPFGEPRRPFFHQSPHSPVYKTSPRCQIKRESRSCNASKDILWFRGDVRLCRLFPGSRALRGGPPPVFEDRTEKACCTPRTGAAPSSTVGGLP